MGKGSIRYIYPGGNTGNGFYSFYKEGLEGLERVFILKGGPGTGKSTIIRKVANDMVERGYNVDLWQCSSDSNSLDGVIIKELKIAVVDGTPPHNIDPTYPGVIESIINLGELWQVENLREEKDEIIDLVKENKLNYKNAYENLEEAKNCQKEIDKKVALENENWLENGKDILEKISNVVFAYDENREKNYFASTFTTIGYNSFMQDLTEKCKGRILLSGESTEEINYILSKIVETARRKNQKITMFHHPLIPEYLEGIILNNLDFAIISSEIPGLEPCINDQVIMLSTSHSSEKVAELKGRKDRKIHLAIGYIKEAKNIHDELESYYINSMDFQGLDKVTSNLFAEIWKMAQEKEE